MPETFPNELIVKGTPTEVRPGRVLSLAFNEGAGKDDVTIFLCHGAGGSKNQWRPQWQALAAEGYRLVAWDNTGHGESRTPKVEAAYDGREFVADYLQILARYGRGKAVLVGHSYGTRLTLAALLALAAEKRLDQVKSAVLLGAPPPIAVMNTSLSPIVTRPLWILTLMRPLLSRGFNKLAWDPGADAALVGYERRLSDKNSLFMMKHMMRQTVPLDVGRLGQLTIPIHILAGASDKLTPPAAGEALAKALPQATVETLAGCGHQIMLERPGETLAAVRRAIAV